MPEEVGIVMKLYDQVSPSLKSIAGNTKAFDKDMTTERPNGHKKADKKERKLILAAPNDALQPS